MIEDINLQEPMSTCCNADLMPGYETNVCSKCKEQCSIGYECPKCQAKGEYLGITNEMTGCEDCNGTGQLIIDE